MNAWKNCLLLLVLAGVGASTAPAASIEQLKLADRVDPVFPSGLSLFGVTRGSARCVLDVDANGRVEDVLVIAHTHEFIAVAVKSVLPQWRFEPARVDGRAVPAQTTLEITLQAEGAVTTLDVSSTIMRRLETVWGQRYEFVAATLRDVDATPVAEQNPAPRYPDELAARGVQGTAVAAFYIDEGGRVRVPIVTRADFPELGVLALEAIRGWKFAPPLRGGRPTLVRVHQEFRFFPKADAEKSAE